MAWKSIQTVTPSERELLARKPVPPSTQFLPEPDMDKLKEAVSNELESVQISKSRTILIRYYSDQGVHKIFVKPERGYAPCGHFVISRLLEKEVKL